MPNAMVIQVEIVDGPAACRHCGQVFAAYRIKTVAGKQNLTDLEGNLIFDLDTVCRSCNNIFGWRVNFRTMREYSQAFHRLMEHYEPKTV